MLTEVTVVEVSSTATLAAVMPVVWFVTLISVVKL